MHNLRRERDTRAQHNGIGLMFQGVILQQEFRQAQPDRLLRVPVVPAAILRRPETAFLHRVATMAFRHAVDDGEHHGDNAEHRFRARLEKCRQTQENMVWQALELRAVGGGHAPMVPHDTAAAIGFRQVRGDTV